MTTPLYAREWASYWTIQRFGPPVMPFPSALADFGGAVVRRTVDASHGLVRPHAHDWPVLSLFVLGAYDNRTEVGDARFARPSAILYRPGAWHENRIGDCGFEQIEIEFDPQWLGGSPLPDLPATRLTGSTLGAVIRQLALDVAAIDEQELKERIIALLAIARQTREGPEPAWLSRLECELHTAEQINVRELAACLGRHPVWVGQRYRGATGESLQQAIARVRVERAAKLLRESDDGAAQIAVDAGFCDQSHMIRTFRRLLGRTPAEVRTDVLRSGDLMVASAKCSTT
jgi:AraC family transcriptional regulator